MIIAISIKIGGHAGALASWRISARLLQQAVYALGLGCVILHESVRQGTWAIMLRVPLVTGI